MHICNPCLSGKPREMKESSPDNEFIMFNVHLQGVRILQALASLSTCATCGVSVGRCEGACVSGHMASQTSTFPLFQGIMEHPSGHFPSDL